MSLFNPIKKQYTRLTELIGPLHCCDLESAAQVMRVRVDKVAGNLRKMTERGLFGADTPYIDGEMSMIVTDRRYHSFACFYSTAARLKWDLRRARNICIFTPEERSQIRSRTAQSFLADMVDSAFSGYGAGRMIRERGSAYLRDLISPDNAMPRADTASVIDSLSGLCDSLLAFLRMNPDLKPAPLQLHFISNTHRQILSFISCYPGNALPTVSQQRTAQGIIAKLRVDTLPRFEQLLQELANAGEASPAREMTPTAELQEQASRLMTVSCQMKPGSMRSSVSRIAGLLNEIAVQIEYAPARAGTACIRSLRSVYLPMMQELLMKYLRYDRMLDPGEDVTAAMKETESIFKSDLPKALKQMLRDLESDSAIDLESQAEALKKKMQLDGLLDPIGKNGGSEGM